MDFIIGPIGETNNKISCPKDRGLLEGWEGGLLQNQLPNGWLIRKGEGPRFNR